MQQHSKSATAQQECYSTAIVLQHSKSARVQEYKRRPFQNSNNVEEYYSTSSATLNYNTPINLVE